MTDLVLRTRINATRTVVFTRFEDGECLTTVIRPIGLQMGNYFDVSPDAASAVVAHITVLQRVMPHIYAASVSPCGSSTAMDKKLRQQAKSLRWRTVSARAPG